MFVIDAGLHTDKNFKLFYNQNEILRQMLSMSGHHFDLLRAEAIFRRRGKVGINWPTENLAKPETILLPDCSKT